jgi:hypothetical protein
MSHQLKHLPSLALPCLALPFSSFQRIHSSYQIPPSKSDPYKWSLYNSALLFHSYLLYSSAYQSIFQPTFLLLLFFVLLCDQFQWHARALIMVNVHHLIYIVLLAVPAKIYRVTLKSHLRILNQTNQKHM